MDGVKGKQRPELWGAARDGRLADLERLLAAGSDPNWTDSEGKTPLEAAAASSRAAGDCVRALLAGGAKLTPEISGRALGSAAFWGRLDVIIALLDAGASPDSRGEEGETPLMEAAKGGQPEIVRELLARGANPALQDMWGYTALTRGVSRSDSAEIVELLVSAGCPIELANDRGRTPLITASLMGHAEAVRALLERGADPRIADPELGTARECALRRRAPGWESVVAGLEAAEARWREVPASADRALPHPIETRPEPTEGQIFRRKCQEFAEAAILDPGLARRIWTDDPRVLESHELLFGETPLHWTVVEGAIEAVRFLAGLGADVNGGNRDGETTVISAASAGNTDMLNVLLSLGADPNVVSRLRGRALECACQSGSPLAMRLLLDAGADAAGIDFNQSLPAPGRQRDEMVQFLRSQRLLRG